jgi:hypothetical protein
LREGDFAPSENVGAINFRIADNPGVIWFCESFAVCGIDLEHGS